MSLQVFAPRVNVNSANPQFPYPPDDRLDPMIKEQLLEDVKSAMKARDKRRVNALRLVAAEIKRKEVDERRPVDAYEDGDVPGRSFSILCVRRVVLITDGPENNFLIVGGKAGA